VRYKDLDWNHVAQDAMQWLAFVNTEINFEFQERKRVHLPTELLSSFDAGICPTDLVNFSPHKIKHFQCHNKPTCSLFAYEGHDAASS
jgi:hypothetical protein